MAKNFLQDMSIKGRLLLLTGVLSLAVVVVAFTGHWGVLRNAKYLETVFADRIIPTDQLSHIREYMDASRVSVLESDRLSAGEVRTAVQAVQSNSAEMGKLWDAYMQTYLTPEEAILAKRFAAERDAWLGQALQPSLASLKRAEVASAKAVMTENANLFVTATDTIQELLDLQIRVAKQEYEASQRTLAMTDWVLAGVGALGIAVGLCVAWMVTRSITHPIGQLRAALDHVGAQRDLTTRLSIASKEECGQMANSFNNVMAALENAIAAIKGQCQELSDSATRLADSAHTMMGSTRSQSEATSSTAAAVQQLAVSFSHVADSAGTASDMARSSNAAAVQGAEIVHSASGEMARIAEDVRASSAVAQSLAQRSNDISSIVQVIKDVADQTNLLALNAAIEAARAGEQGRGFAVVADEVRKLAERTSRSAAEITSLIGHVQTDTRAVVDNMAGSMSRVDLGVELGGKAAQSLGEIRSGVDTTRSKIEEIASATKEQSVASNDIARNVEHIAQMTEQNGAAASQSAGLSESLAGLARSLHSEVASFKTG